jgi:hypothetical protein
MPCNTVQLPGGGTAIVCSRGPKRKRTKCFYCAKPAPYLCDHKEGGARCDRPICGDHAVSKGSDIDWCKIHPMKQPQGVLAF